MKQKEKKTQDISIETETTSETTAEKELPYRSKLRAAKDGGVAQIARVWWVFKLAIAVRLPGDAPARQCHCARAGARLSIALVQKDGVCRWKPTEAKQERETTKLREKPGSSND